MASNSFNSEIRFLNRLERNLALAVEDALTDIAREIVPRVVANAPIKSGKLRLSVTGRVNARVVARGGEQPEESTEQGEAGRRGDIDKTILTIRCVAKDRYGFDYALFMHEYLAPHGAGSSPSRPSLYIGPISQMQPPTPEGGVGGKYIERVMNFYRKRHRTRLLRATRELRRRKSGFRDLPNYF